MEPKTKSRRHLLTILVEDYFHVGAFGKLIQQRNWANFEPRYEKNTRKALDLLEKHDTKATFFVLGWIAEQDPGLLREIVRRGHEVASRGFYHRTLSGLTADELREDLRRTNRAIESACGQKVIGFRSPEKLRFGVDDWVLEVLADEGFVYDASFLPSSSTEKEKRMPHQVRTGSRILWEFPYSTLAAGPIVLPISGGNYFRQIPYTLMRYAVRDWHRRSSAPFVSYFHVWELDPAQPRISAASHLNRLRHYRKLDKMEWIIEENLELYDCTGVADHLGLKEDLRPEVMNASLAPAAPCERGWQNADRKSEITIVIPCYNEVDALAYLANTLTAVRQRLAAKGYFAHLIFVDDRSTDDTFASLERHFGNDPGVRILRHDQNRGVAAGIMTGLKAAETEIVCSMDCDCTYDPHELGNMLPLLTNDVDLVTASPYHRDGGVRNVPGWRLLLSRGASFLYRRVLRSKLDTYTSCFRVYRRSSIVETQLTEPGFLGITEMLGRLDLEGAKIIEYPAVLEVRLFGISKMKTAKTIIGHLKLLARLAKIRLFRNSPAISASLPAEKLK